jgi:hypothetical protein
MRVLVVGYGKMGKLYLKKLKDLFPRIELEIVDPFIDPLKDENLKNIKVSKNVDSIRPECLNLIIISCPTEFHAYYLEYLLKFRTYILCEKPLGYSHPARLAFLERNFLLISSPERYGVLPKLLSLAVRTRGVSVRVVRSSRQRTFSDWLNDLAFHDLDALSELKGVHLDVVSCMGLKKTATKQVGRIELLTSNRYGKEGSRNGSCDRVILDYTCDLDCPNSDVIPVRTLKMTSSFGSAIRVDLTLGTVKAKINPVDFLFFICYLRVCILLFRFKDVDKLTEMLRAVVGLSMSAPFAIKFRNTFNMMRDADEMRSLS